MSKFALLYIFHLKKKKKKKIALQSKTRQHGEPSVTLLHPLQLTVLFHQHSRQATTMVHHQPQVPPPQNTHFFSFLFILFLVIVVFHSHCRFSS